MSAFDKALAAHSDFVRFRTLAGGVDTITVPSGTAEQQVRKELIISIDKVPTPVRLVKLARSGMRSYVHRLHKEQGGLCPLCRAPIDLTIKGEGVLDHDHDTGRIRGVLHRSCNAAEGKISNAAARWGAKSSSYADIIPYLENLVRYLKAEPTNMIYPMHKTPDEKRDARALAAKVKRAELKARRELALRKRQGNE